MKRHFPGKMDFLVLIVMAALCTGIISRVRAKDSGLFFLTLPLFVTSSILGLRKSGRLRADEE